MQKFLIFLAISFQALAQSTSDAVATGVTTLNTVIPVDVSSRGAQIYHTFYSQPHATGARWPEWIFQTTLSPSLNKLCGAYTYIVNGRIPFVQSVSSTPYHTLLIVTYKALSAFNTQYIVVPTESIQEVIYISQQYNEPPNVLPFTSTFAPGVTPYFSLDPQARLADIISAVETLQSPSFATGQSQVWLLTTLSGPFYPSLSSTGSQGIVQNVLSVSQVTNGLLKVTFLPNNQPISQTLFIAPEQIQQIFYIPFQNNPLQPR